MKKQANIQGIDIEMKSFKTTTNLFEITETTEQVYVGGQISKTTNKPDAIHAGNNRNATSGVSTLQTNPMKGRDRSETEKNSCHQIFALTCTK